MPEQPLVHSIPWLELHTSDTEPARAFYQELLGWTMVAEDMEGHQDYHVFREPGTDSIAGIIRSVAGASKAEWIPYVAVSNLQESTDRCLELGATLVVPITRIGKWGAYCIFRDPFGAMTALWQTAAD